MREQISRLGDEVVDIYAYGNTTNRVADNDRRVREYSVRQKGYLKFPFGRFNPCVSMLNLHIMKKSNRKLAAIIDAGGYDAVLVHSCFTTQTPPILQYLRTPSVYYCHEPLRGVHEALISGGPFVPWFAPASMLLRRMAAASEYNGLRSATRVLCNSHFVRETLLRIYGVDSEVNYLGVDTSVFHPLDVEREHAVVSVGAMAPFKCHEFIIESISRIPSAKRPLLRIVCGRYNPGGRIDLERLCQDKSVAVEFYPDISDAELVSIYCRSKATVYAPILEPFGLVPIESMACGTPVVAVCEGGIRETVIDGVTGLLTKRDPDEFADAVTRVVSDPKMIREMGGAGQKDVDKKWTWDASVSKLRRTLEEVSSSD